MLVTIAGIAPTAVLNACSIGRSRAASTALTTPSLLML